ISQLQTITDGETIISSGEKFELGFFSPKDSIFRYVGIWYHKVSQESIVWVANRANPITGNKGVLTIGKNGNLIILNRINGDIIWSSNVTVQSNNSTAVLMDTGDFVLFNDRQTSNVLWRSFDYPTDTYLPQMRVHVDFDKGEKRIFTSWKSANDPSIGSYSMGIDPRGSPQIVIYEGQNRKWRSGHWNGLIFVGVQGMRGVYLFGFKLFNEDDGKIYFIYVPCNSSDLMNFSLTWDGIERQEKWKAEQRRWDLIQSHPGGVCDKYNYCGPFGICNEIGVPKCSCVKGFVPKDDEEWSRGNWSSGCIRRRKFECRGRIQNSFVQVERVKLPDFVDFVGSEDGKDCEKRCRENCSCVAYAFVSGINCMIWNQDLVDVQQFEEGGSTLFVLLANSEREILNRIDIPKAGPSGEEPQETGTELAMFSFNYVASTTGNFSDENKLGQGGFGHVYKGKLPGGEEIAVKRLCKNSDQGLEEFKNEIMLIAKLQHRNLVRLLGCCIDGEEKMLLYEYMPNKSLDLYLFDPEKKARLDWSKRFSIIEGIARGLLYLHRDSRLRIIHRDLKASNILLDEEMNPKISDFGMARIFGGNQNEANTNRVVGTYGYMAPEYAMEGFFSFKSDVYSFGVLLLEIVMGRRNTSFRSSEHTNIIGYAWDLFDRGRAIELMDSLILDSCSQEQVLRCIHVGMLCVQDVVDHRPNMPGVVLMLESENATLPMPKQPTFTSIRHNVDINMWNGNQDVVSLNDVTITEIFGR
ncbi:hypothetical protein RD792_007761, partial [Penstemon davidsonii]